MQKTMRRDNCRLCRSKDLELVLPILPSAIGDAFVPKERLDEPQETFSLDTYLCRSCGHLQNLDLVDPNILFGNYTYRTSVSLGLVEHFRKYAQTVVENLTLPKGAQVVEMGSNDGSLLKAFKAQGMQVLGIDPAANIARQATEEGIPTIATFFSSAVAQKIRAEHGQAAVFCANNVYAHIDNMEDVTRGIRTLLAPDGAFVFEVSYILDMIDNMVFDTIYHEHVSHHALKPLEQFFNQLDLTLFDVARLPSKGGSIRGFAQPLSTGKRPKTQRLLDFYAEEERRDITQPALYRSFYDSIEARKCETLDFLRKAVAEGKTIAAYGASTTTTTLLYHFELGPFLKFIADDNPIKHGTYSPGWHIPVLPSSALLEQKPDITVILAWMYVDPIAKRNEAYLKAGGKFLAPLPAFRVIGA